MDCTLPPFPPNFFPFSALLLGYGKVANYANATLTSTPTANTIYAIDSVTKTFTCLLMMILRDKNIVALDSDVSNYLPGFTLNNPYFPSKRFVTLRTLSSHLSGLPRNTPCFNYTGCAVPTVEMLTRMSSLPLMIPPYTIPAYSNLGISLLGHALAAAANNNPNPSTTLFVDLLQQEVLLPLGLTDTVFSLDQEQLTRVAYSSRQPPPQNPSPALSWDLPAGGLWSSTADILKYLQLLLSFVSASTQPTQSIVDPWTLREWIDQQLFVLPNGKTGSGMPWENKLHTDTWTNYKGGTGSGYTSGIWFAPSLNVGFTVLTASQSEPYLSHEIAALIFPAVQKYLSQAEPRDYLPANYQAFLGTFATPDRSLSLTWIVRNQSGYTFLALDVPTPPFPMLRLISLDEQTSTATFRATPYPLGVQRDACAELEGGLDFEYISFQLDTQGVATSLTIPGIIFQQTAFRSNT